MGSGKLVVVALVATIALAACGESPPSTGCNDDDDCDPGEHCASGGCTFVCREDPDCLPFGTTAVCTDRGRCFVPGTIDGGGLTCASDVDCDDGVFCDGPGRCDPADPAADPNGCVAGVAPCALDDCDEAIDSCDTCRDPDDDDDGYDDRACGGLDCDDTNPRIPGPEICRFPIDDYVDEDCNPATVAAPSQDGDSDGYPPSTCCNGPEESRICGLDCSDDVTVDIHAPQRNVATTESCDYFDNDCDGRVDERDGRELGLQAVYYADRDCDRHGIAIPEPVREPDGSLPPEVAAYARLVCPADPTLDDCLAGPGGFPAWTPIHDDCAPENPAVFPGAPESCDAGRVDDDCDGVANDGCPCTPDVDPPAACGSTDVGECAYGRSACIPPGVRSTVCEGEILPRTETCVGSARGRDEDCDGNVDEGLINACGRCRETEPAEVCNGVDDNCDGVADPGACSPLGSFIYRTEPTCGARLRRECIGRDTASCFYGPETGAADFSYVYPVTDPRFSHACGRATDAGWETRTPCSGFLVGPGETRLPYDTRTRGVLNFRNNGCVRFALEAYNATTGQVLTRNEERVVCGDDVGFEIVTFTIPYTGAPGCPSIQLRVDVIDTPSSSFTATAVSFSAAP